MAAVIAAKDGTEEEKEKAMATLIVGVKQIQEKVAEHLLTMKAETKAIPADDALAEESPVRSWQHRRHDDDCTRAVLRDLRNRDFPRPPSLLRLPLCASGLRTK